MRLPTIQIKADNEHGFITINESDLTDDMVLFGVDELELTYIEHMNKGQLMAFIKENAIELPSDVTKVTDIKKFLLESKEELDDDFLDGLE